MITAAEPISAAGRPSAPLPSDADPCPPPTHAPLARRLLRGADSASLSGDASHAEELLREFASYVASSLVEVEVGPASTRGRQPGDATARGGVDQIRLIFRVESEFEEDGLDEAVAAAATVSVRHAARSRGADPACPAPHEPRDRRSARDQRENRGAPRRAHPAQAPRPEPPRGDRTRPRPRRPTAAAPRRAPTRHSSRPQLALVSPCRDRRFLGFHPGVEVAGARAKRACETVCQGRDEADATRWSDARPRMSPRGFHVGGARGRAGSRGTARRRARS